MLLCWFIIYSSYIDRKSQRKYSWKKIKRALGKQEVKHCAFSKRVEILFPYYWYLNWGKRGCICLSKCSIIPLNIKALTIWFDCSIHIQSMSTGTWIPAWTLVGLDWLPLSIACEAGAAPSGGRSWAKSRSNWW